MKVFVAIPAILSVLNADDAFDPRAQRIWSDLLQHGEGSDCTSYVLVECFALVQHRLGVAALRALVDDILPVIRMHWVDPEEHQEGPVQR